MTRGWAARAWDRNGSGWVRVADLRIPQIGTFFQPVSGEANNAREAGCALASRCRAVSNDIFLDFFGACEIAKPEISNPRVAGSSPAGRIKKARKNGAFRIFGEA